MLPGVLKFNAKAGDVSLRHCAFVLRRGAAVRGTVNHMTLQRPVVSPPNPWRWSAWLAWSLVVVAAFLACSIATFMIAWGDSTTCNEPAAHAQLVQGQRHILLAAGLLLGAWAFVTCFSPRRWARMLLGFAISAVPLVLLALTHTRASDWTGGFCI